jgi:hypothetical protein
MNKVLTTLCAITLLARFVNMAVSVATVGPFAWGYSPGTYADSPYLKYYGLSILVANTLDCFLFIIGTFVFLFAISKALGISTYNILAAIAMDYDGVDYFTLIALKLYILWCGIYLAINSKNNNFTNPAIGIFILT